MGIALFRTLCWSVDALMLSPICLRKCCVVAEPLAPFPGLIKPALIRFSLEPTTAPWGHEREHPSTWVGLFDAHNRTADRVGDSDG